MGCFSVVIVLVLGVFMMVTFIRWFEHTADAVDRGAWRELMMLIVMPFAVWILPSRVSSGRPIPVPKHEPVRGFGTIKSKSNGLAEASPPLEAPKPAVKKSGIDEELVEKLRKKMRDQGMLPPE